MYFWGLGKYVQQGIQELRANTWDLRRVGALGPLRLRASKKINKLSIEKGLKNS